MASPFEEQINGALESIRTHQYPSIRAAAKAYGVNHRTLTRRLRGGLSYTQARQPQLLLSPEQEDLLVRWILDLERLGHPPNHTQIREFVVLIYKAAGSSPTIGIN